MQNFEFEGYTRTIEFVKTKKEKKPFNDFYSGKKKRKPDRSQIRERKRSYDLA